MVLEYLLFAGIFLSAIVYLILVLKQQRDIAKYRKLADDCFKSIDNAPVEQKAALWLEGQSYNREIDNRYEDRRSWRDLLLEIVVIVLIAFELHDAGQQSAILGALNTSSSDTAQAIKTLVQDQKSSVATQKDSLTKIQQMNDVVAKQLDLLKQEQEERSAQENSHPKFTAWAESYDIREQRLHSVSLEDLPNQGRPSVGLLREPWVDNSAVTVRLVLRNIGNATALNVVVVPRVPTGVVVRCVEFPYLRLATAETKSPPDCSSPPTAIPPMQPRPQTRTQTDGQNSVLDSTFDTSIWIRLTVPTGKDFEYFAMEVRAQADRMQPAIFHVSCHVWN